MSDAAICPAAVTLCAADTAGIYFIQQGEAGPIKIGWSRNVRTRIATFQTASPYPLRLLLVLAGEERDERRLHDWFSRERLNGEWFKSDGEVAAFIAAKLKAPDPNDHTRCKYSADPGALLLALYEANAEVLVVDRQLALRAPRAISEELRAETRAHAAQLRGLLLMKDRSVIAAQRRISGFLTSLGGDL